MPYIVKAFGIEITSAIGTFPAYDTAAGATSVAVDTVNPHVIVVSGWTLDEQATREILDTDAHVWLPGAGTGGAVGQILGLTWSEISPGVYQLWIALDIDAT